MGNRGILHDENKRIVKPWAHQNWVTCLLSFKNIKRRPFSQRKYSELFFLDEATAFAAGHRPCAQCQRKRNLEFKDVWLRANYPERSGLQMNWDEIDKALHNERAIRGGYKRTFESTLADLPVGAMFEWEGMAYLVSARGYLCWSFEGYGNPVTIDRNAQILVLTPPSIVRAFTAGFVPNVHLSAAD